MRDGNKKKEGAVTDAVSRVKKMVGRVVPTRKRDGEIPEREMTGNREEKKLPFFTDSFANRIGVDLGTATTVVYVDGKGVILREPTLVSVNKQTDQIVAVGRKARMMVGRTPKHIEVIQPVQQGVISDYEVTEQLFEYIFRRVQDVSPKIFGPTVIIGIPCRASQTEVNAVRDAAVDAGARQVYIVNEPLAAAIGIDVPLGSEEAVMVVDVGGGTSDAMILAAGEVVSSDSIRLAGDAFDAAILEGLRHKRRLTIGIRTAEDLKVATMQSAGERKTFSVQGRNTANGLPMEVEVTFEEILDFITPCIEEIAEYIGTFVRTTSPEILADLKNNNIYFVGGGPAVYTFSKKIERALNLSIIVPDGPMTAVARGTAIIARNPDHYKKYFLS